MQPPKRGIISVPQAHWGIVSPASRAGAACSEDTVPELESDTFCPWSALHTPPGGSGSRV